MFIVYMNGEPYYEYATEDEAVYQIEAMTEADERNGERHDYYYELIKEV